MSFDTLVVGKIYSNNEVMSIFSCSGQGGIRVSNKNKTVTLISKIIRRNETNPYQDEHMTSDGRITYTGMGTRGDQKLDGQNLKVAKSRTNGYRLFYFEVYKDNEYTYKGELILDDEPYFEEEKDLDGNLRKVIKFKLKVKTLVDEVYISEENFIEETIQKEKAVDKLSTDKLAELAVNADNETKSVKVVSEQYVRDIKVKQYTLRRADGKCDLCNEEAPFVNSKGEPYLESHHVVSLSDNGKDSIVNTVALCPNCHRKMHYAKDKKKDLSKLKEKLNKYIINDPHITYEDQMELIKIYKENFGIK